jgi:hypothetical protein
LSTSTRLDAFDSIIDGFMYYVDWQDSPSVPYHVNINTKREGHPRRFILQDIDYPLACVQTRSRSSGGLMGREQKIIVSVRVWYVMQFNADDYIDEILRQQIGKIEENILQSNNLGLDWITQLQWDRTDFEDPLEQYFRNNSSQFTTGAIDFSATLIEDQTQ